MVKIDISLKRVQSFIFEVPRLKAMLGANALVGQVMRSELTALLGDRGKNLEWPNGLSLSSVADPLAAVQQATEHRDDPRALFAKGILARDGGRFIAVFSDFSGASAFRCVAEELLAHRLPGVLFDIEIMDFDLDGTHSLGPQVSRPMEYQVLDLPVLQVCQETGREPAAEETFDDSGRPHYRAESVAYREEWGDKFYRGRTKDVIGLLRSALYPEDRGSDPGDLSDLASNGYIALIHADGNGIGKRYKAWKATSAQNSVAKEAGGEAFFHSMRVAVRRALIDALAAVFPAASSGSKRAYEVLMLGGDDLLLVCRADHALDFSVRYACELQNYVLADGKALDVAIGVAVAKKTYPLHRLHDLAESLATSAKQLYRSQLSQPEAERSSVIDWQVVTQSWFDSGAEARRAAEMIQYAVDGAKETLLLTGRPYQISGNEGLEGLCAAARAVNGKDADGGRQQARSPMRALRQACERGRLSGDMAFDEFSKARRIQLGWGDECLWKPLSVGNENVYITRALDIVGIGEISGLGRKRA